jgi:hypothetical protein
MVEISDLQVKKARRYSRVSGHEPRNLRPVGSFSRIQVDNWPRKASVLGQGRSCRPNPSTLGREWFRLFACGGLRVPFVVAGSTDVPRVMPPRVEREGRGRKVNTACSTTVGVRPGDISGRRDRPKASHRPRLRFCCASAGRQGRRSRSMAYLADTDEVFDLDVSVTRNRSPEPCSRTARPEQARSDE